MKRMEQHNERLLNALEQLENQCPAENPQLSQSENDKLVRMAMTRLETQPQQKTRKFPVWRRSLRMGLVAAAVVCIGSISVYAGVTLLPMAAEKIGFFEGAPSRSEAQDPANAPRGEHSGMQNAEGFNTAVGQSVTDSGVTVTLDNISMDVAGMDLYFTVEGKEAIDELLEKEKAAHNEYLPQWHQISIGIDDMFDIRVNGNEMSQASASADDSYLTEDGVLKVFSHYPFMRLPEGEELSVELSAKNVLGREGSWNFQLNLDGNSVRAGGLLGETGKHSMPKIPAQEDGTPEQSQDLELVYLAFGHRSGVAVTRVKEVEFTLADGYTQAYIQNGRNMSSFKITDSTGKDLFKSDRSCAPCTFDEDGYGYFVETFTLPDPTATSITLMPMNFEQDDMKENIVTTEELKNGAKLPTGPESGYTVKNYAIEGSSIRYELEPYGWNLGYWELIPDDDSVTLYKEVDGGLRVGLSSDIVDPSTGVISCRHDYYAATQQELEDISQWKYCFGSYRPDPEHAVTIPLHKADVSK